MRLSPPLVVLPADPLLGPAIARLAAAQCPVHIATSAPELRRAVDAAGELGGVLLDVDAGSEVALDLLDFARARHPTIPMALVADRVSASWANRAFALHAGIVFKPFAWEDLRPFIARATATRADTDAVEVTLREFVQQAALTPRQAMLVAHAVAGTRRAAVSGTLGISENTIKTQVRKLLRKVDAANLDEVALRVFRAARMHPR